MSKESVTDQGDLREEGDKEEDEKTMRST